MRYPGEAERRRGALALGCNYASHPPQAVDLQHRGPRQQADAGRPLGVPGDPGGVVAFPGRGEERCCFFIARVGEDRARRVAGLPVGRKTHRKPKPGVTGAAGAGCSEAARPSVSACCSQKPELHPCSPTPSEERETPPGARLRSHGATVSCPALVCPAHWSTPIVRSGADQL